MTPKNGSAGASAPTDLPPVTRPRQRSGLWAIMGLGLLLCGAIALWHLVQWSQLQIWAAQEQRGFQTAMAGALRAIRGGDPFAIWTLCVATAAYGFVHAVGPGHGKVLLGGAALASGATLRRMAILTLSASLAQSAFAIILVGGLGFALGWATQDLVGLTEVWLAPASAFAVSALGLVLVIRGVLGWPNHRAVANPDGHDHTNAGSECGCGHSHGPSVAELQSLGSLREALALVGSIALRPCTGALFVLVIALGMGVFWVGCVAVLAMGLGTAAFNLMVAGSGVAARKLVDVQATGQQLQQISAGLHVAGGAIIALISFSLAITYLDSPVSFP